MKYVVVYTCRVHFCSAGIRGHSFMLETMDIYLYFVVSVLENKRFSFQTLNSSSQAFGVADACQCVCALDATLLQYMKFMRFSCINNLIESTILFWILYLRNTALFIFWTLASAFFSCYSQKVHISSNIFQCSVKVQIDHMLSPHSKKT